MQMQTRNLPPPLMEPQGSVGTTTDNPGSSWYTIKAAATRGVAEVYLFGDIGDWGISAQQFANDLRAVGDVSQINLHINSPGGAVFEGMAMYNLLKSHKARVIGTVVGLAASMGSVVAMACDEIRMPANAMMMVHKPWGIQGGDAEAMRKYAETLDKFETGMVAVYVAKTGKSVEEVEALLTAETWMTGAEAVALGFADTLLDPIEAFATINSNRLKDYTNMPPAAQHLFTPRGSVTPPVGGPATTPGNPTETAEQIAARVLAADGARRTAIQAAFTPFTGHETLRDTCLNDPGCTPEQANAKLLEVIGQGTTPTGTVRHHGHLTNGNLVGDSVRASIYARAGLDELQNDNGFNFMTLRELARASLVERGVGVSTLNVMNMIGLAFTHGSSDFGNILLDAAYKSLLTGWEKSEETYHLWTKKGRLSDFKVANRVGLGSFSSLREVRPGADYKNITLGDTGETIQLATYGELFTINRQAIINDDLDALTAIPRLMGEAARATIGDLVYDLLTKNGKMKDGRPLFDASRKNLFTGAASKLSIEAMSAAKTAMALQQATVAKDAKPRPLNIRPAFLLCPVALEDKANQLIRSASVPGADTNAGIDNPIRNFAQVIAEPRLDADSSSAYYLAAKQGSDTIEVAYLDGIETPYFDQQEGFTSDGIASKVRIDAGVSALDARGLNKSAGQ
ncbi:ClpP-like prohead protease/major capsid protein fusion protein [Pseudomonas sp. URMO17WK12:I11]|uniref:ClpP-like prohead protease/major capsid protein fusion protein n=2 Tax=Pseudomonas TaxID=286 RepID=UPI003528B84A